MEPDSTVIVVTGGDPIDPAEVGPLPPADRVIAADSGLDHARRLGLAVDLVVGDFDSVSAEALALALADGVTVDSHPAAKDRTDLALALDHAVADRPARVLVIGGDGGRLDHLMANLLLLAADDYRSTEIEARLGPARVYVIRRRAALHGQAGELVTLLPVHGPARGVTTEGLLYPLRGEDLHPGTSRGVSNEFEAVDATVALQDGVLLTVQPGEPSQGSALKPSPAVPSRARPPTR